MWNLGDLLVLFTGGAKTERLPLTGLPRHKDYNSGQTRIPDAIQHGDR